MGLNNKKIAVVLLNLGGPDSLASVRPFLFNLFYDRFIVKLPKPLRFIVAFMISTLRDKKAQAIYKQVGGRSPILQETNKQKEALEKYLSGVGEQVEVFICMRHWHPMSEEVVSNLEGFDEIILLPLYPQFSSTTTLSSIIDFKEAIARQGIIVPVKSICCYYDNERFIKAHAELIKESINNLTSANYRLLFSAHGLPKKIIKAGDPYQWQVENSVKTIVDILKVADLDYRISYQSRVGPVEWIGPNTEDEIKIACNDGKDLIVVPIAFVSEHVETLVELDIEYRAIVDEFGMKYYRVPTLGTSKLFIEALGDVVRGAANSSMDLLCAASAKCPSNFSMCYCANQQ